MENKGNDVFKVAANTEPNKLAGAIAGVVRKHESAEIYGVGAGAINQAVKAAAIARGFMAPSGIELAVFPSFMDIGIDGKERTAIRLLVRAI